MIVSNSCFLDLSVADWQSLYIQYDFIPRWYAEFCNLFVVASRNDIRREMTKPGSVWIKQMTRARSREDFMDFRYIYTYIHVYKGKALIHHAFEIELLMYVPFGAVIRSPKGVSKWKGPTGTRSWYSSYQMTFAINRVTRPEPTYRP